MLADYTSSVADKLGPLSSNVMYEAMQKNLDFIFHSDINFNTQVKPVLRRCASSVKNHRQVKCILAFNNLEN